MYNALITDIDGTVAAIGTDGSDISEHTRQIVSRAISKGKRITCATGRGWPSSKPVIQRLGLIDPCIIEGGSCIINPESEEILWEVQLDEMASSAILSIFKRLATDNVYIKSTSDKSRLPLAQVTNVTGSNRIIYLLGVDAQTAELVVNEVNNTGFAVAHKTTPSWYGPQLTDVHVTNPDGTKEHAIEQWLSMMKVNKSETIGLGDSENDLPLFKSVGLRIAVDNAHDNLKAQADHIVAAYDKGGLDQAISTYLL
ncbi:MAG TPA: HAD family hydrolase [Candidatus Saccharimonadales bacterium]